MRSALSCLLAVFAALTVLSSSGCKKTETPTVPENVLTAATPAPNGTEETAADKTQEPTATEAPAVEQSAVCNANGVHVRSGPGIDYDEVAVIDADTALSVTQSFITPQWHEILYSGNVCYIYAKYVTLSSQPASVTVDTTQAAQPSTLYAGWVTGSKLNVRKTASTSGHVLGEYKKGDLVSLVSKTPQDGWYQVWYDHQYAYVFAQYVTTSIPSAKKATPAPDVSGYVTGVARGSVVALRDAPYLTGSRVIREIKQGTTVYIDYYKGDYYCVRLSPGGTQYFAAKRLISTYGEVPEVIG